MHEIKIVVVDAKRNWREIVHGKKPIVSMGSYRRDVSGEWETHCGVVMTAETANAIVGALQTKALCQSFMALFRDSDMRPEDECHELYDAMQVALGPEEERKVPEDCPPDWAVPAWAEAEKVHDWRNHIGEEIQAMWHTFAPFQKQALATDAQYHANEEEWE
jgi:hypothetical protein